MTALVGPYARHEDWPSGLAHELQVSRDLPFVWGENDCLQFAGRCVEAQTGTNPLAVHIGKYTSSREALEVLRRREQVRLPIDLADKLWGSRKPIAWAKMGDLVATSMCEPKSMGFSLGVCYGRNSFFVGTQGGYSRLIRLDTLTLEHCYQPWALS